MRLNTTPRAVEQGREEEQRRAARREALRAEQHQRQHASEDELRREGHAHAPGECAGELTADGHVAEAKPRYTRSAQNVIWPTEASCADLELAAPAFRDPHVDQDHERRAGRDRGQEEGDGHHRRPPLRGEHVRHQQVQRAERALVHGRQRDGGDGEHDRLGLRSRRAEDPGERAEDSRPSPSRVEEVAREQVDEQRHCARHVGAVPSPPDVATARWYPQCVRTARAGIRAARIVT